MTKPVGSFDKRSNDNDKVYKGKAKANVDKGEVVEDAVHDDPVDQR